MAKISDITAYPNQSPVALTDYLIGTDNTTKATKTFTVQDLANAIDDQVSLQEVLTVGNTDGGVGMSVTGASSFGNLTLTGTLTAGGGVGTAGQFLSSTGTGIQWVSETFVDGSGTQHFIPVWQDADTLTDSVIAQNVPATRVTIDGADLNLTQDLYISQNIFHLNDLNTSISFPSDDNFSVTTNGTEKFKADENKLMLYYQGDIKAETTSSGAKVINGSSNAILEIPMASSATDGIRFLGGVNASANRPTISPMNSTGDIRFGDQGSGQVFDFQQNKIAFDTDATNTFIKADNNDPESLEIHADNDVDLRADRHVIINGTVPAGPSSTGVRGAIIYDNDYIYVCVQTDTWKRVAISSW